MIRFPKKEFTHKLVKKINFFPLALVFFEKRTIFAPLKVCLRQIYILKLRVFYANYPTISSQRKNSGSQEK